MSWQGMADRMLGVAIRTFEAARDSDDVLQVEYAPVSGPPYLLSAVFRDESVQVDPVSGVAISTTNPTLGVRYSDMTTKPRKGDTVVVRGTEYTVLELRGDGEVGAILELQET